MTVTNRVTLEDVRHVATLARLGVTDAQANELTRELNTILEHMDVLSKVDTKRAEEASGVGAAGMRLRPDHGPAIPLSESLEAFMPSMRAGLILVPRLATHESTVGEENP